MLREVLADLTAAFHLAYFSAVVAGLVCIWVGAKDWAWTRNLWFRLSHLLAIGIVLVENTFGLSCPLNRLEWGLRAAAPAAAAPAAAKEASTGVGFVLDQLLFHTLSGNLLNGLWWVFGVLALALLVLVPPRFTASVD
jgi:hypothetical protein